MSRSTEKRKTYVPKKAGPKVATKKKTHKGPHKVAPSSTSAWGSRGLQPRIVRTKGKDQNKGGGEIVEKGGKKSKKAANTASAKQQKGRKHVKKRSKNTKPGNRERTNR